MSNDSTINSIRQAKNLPSLDRLKEALNYNMETGVFTWRYRPLSHFRTANTQCAFNSRYCGEKAGSIIADGYLIIGVFSVAIKAHRMALLFITGKWPTLLVDHINGVRDDNRGVNLREVSRVGSMKNRRVHDSSVTGVGGVSPKGQKFRAQCHVNGVNTYLGIYPTLAEAAEAVRLARLRDGGHSERHGQ